MKTLENTIIANFQKLHPGTTVKAVQVPSEQMHQKLVTGVASGSLPDVIRADIVAVPELAKLGVLTPLDEAMPDFDTYAKKVYPGPLSTNKYKDKYWGLPLDTNTKVVVYNKEVLSAAGVTEVPKTLDELKAAAPKVGGGKYVFAEAGSAGWNLLPFVWSNGGEMTDPEVTKASGFINGPKSVAALQMLIDMYNASSSRRSSSAAPGGWGPWTAWPRAPTPPSSTAPGPSRTWSRATPTSLPRPHRCSAARVAASASSAARTSS